MARYKITVCKCTYTWANNERQWREHDSTFLHVNASNKDKAMEKFDKLHPIDETDGYIYTFDIVTDNLKKDSDSETKPKAVAKKKAAAKKSTTKQKAVAKKTAAKKKVTKKKGK